MKHLWWEPNHWWDFILHPIKTAHWMRDKWALAEAQELLRLERIMAESDEA